MKTIFKSNRTTNLLVPKLYCACFFIFIFQLINAQTVTPWLTKGDQSVKLQQQNTVSFSNGNESGVNSININTGTTYQNIDGFGFALTQGSAQALSNLNSTTQNNLLNELFDPSSGNAISIVRISIGASDLSNSVYSYNETSGDVNMNNFSLNGPDKTYLLPILKKILAINPNIKILATPWTAPTWMKTNNTWIGGSLRTQYYEAYANYFVKYLQAMDAEGLSIWAITPQNEPENPFNEPSMLMNSTEQKNFINNNLGPAFASAGYSTKIIAFDHNCDNTAYPIDVLNNSSYTEGAAFHLYAGNISAMSTVKNQTGKNVYFTEQFTSSNGNFDGDFGWHMENVVIGSLRNWSKTVIEWNLASNSDYGPRTPGGCTECLGAITVNGSNSISRNVSYYIIGQISKFVKPGAQRIASNNGSDILTAAFKNTDNSYAVIAYNKSASQKTLHLNWSGKTVQYNVPGRSAVTFNWSSAAPSTPPSSPSGLSAVAGDKQVQLNWNSSAGASSYTVRRSNSSSGSFTTIQSNVTSNSYINTGLTNGTKYYYRVRAVNSVGSSGDSNTASATPTAQIRDAFNRIEAEDYDDSLGIQVENTSDSGGGQNVGYTDTNDYLLYENTDFGSGARSVEARVASNSTFTGSIEFRVGSTTGNLLGTLDIGNTGGWQSWTTKNININLTTGVKNLYLVFKGGNGIGNLNWIKFSTSSISTGGGGGNDIVSGEIYRITNKATGKVMDVSGVSQNNGARIHQWTWGNGNNQKWKVESVGKGNYKLTAQHSNKSLDIVDGSTANGTEIQQWDYFGNDNQKWKIQEASTGFYKIISVKSNKALEVPGGQNTNGIKLVQNSSNNTNQQQWEFQIFSGAASKTIPKENEQMYEDEFASVFPNPVTNNQLNVYLRDLNDASFLFLTDLSGKTVFKTQLLKENSQIELPELSEGIYIVKISNDKQSKTSKILIK
ncbi:carbohydrate-binding protein [Galbibacter sp. BG1]|uniref:carbohydrate-binding protein n=1 Tax=Galbibacter sp. BG1 TaxID=1170699 RepID=UPI0015BDBEF4|nr:carbohydrate-binding protein [Galbibacter sp. BG1]QLE01270.1 carbohydrate-binding protein [Galbibacter sp. BG1]